MKNKLPIIGITMGDPVGIGPEILVSALDDPDIYSVCRPLVLGDRSVTEAALELKGCRLSIHPVSGPEDGHYCHGALDLMPVSSLEHAQLKPGMPDAQTGTAMLRYITHAVELANESRISAVVTCPITKTAMKMAGSPFHGHTEMIAHMTGSRDYAMMLAGPRLRVVLVTIHMALSSVPANLTREAVVKTIRITGDALKERFRIQDPRIAVAGLNPHAGEDSMFGTEESLIIAPAVNEARKLGYNVSGPHPPDTLFFHAARGSFDAVVCMYHDQGLIPFKMIHFSDGVNTTLGLPIIRTSVDHGTAYDIAWKGKADHTSLKEAIRMAAFQAGTSRS